MIVKNIATGEVADCEWRTDHPESIRLGALKAEKLKGLFGIFGDLPLQPEPVLVNKATGELFRANPLMMIMEGDPVGTLKGLPNSGRGYVFDENLRPKFILGGIDEKKE